MDIYVAGSRHERDWVRQVQQRLRDNGHNITYDWTGAEGKILESHADGHHGDDAAFWATVAEKEIEAIRDADALVACMSPTGKGRGMFIEIGVALECGMPIYLLGDAKANDSNFYVLDQFTLFRHNDDLLNHLDFVEYSHMVGME